MNTIATYHIVTTTTFKNGNQRTKHNHFQDTLEHLQKNLENARKNYAEWSIKNFSYENGKIFGFAARKGNVERFCMVWI